jgi:hypothetical protein
MESGDQCSRVESGQPDSSVETDETFEQPLTVEVGEPERVSRNSRNFFMI